LLLFVLSRDPLGRDVAAALQRVEQRALLACLSTKEKKGK
jgi:hypothetical protein